MTLAKRGRGLTEFKTSLDEGKGVFENLDVPFPVLFIFLARHYYRMQIEALYFSSLSIRRVFKYHYEIISKCFKCCRIKHFRRFRARDI